MMMMMMMTMMTFPNTMTLMLRRLACASALLCLLLAIDSATGAPLAPTTLDGATPISAKVTATEFGSEIEAQFKEANGAVVTHSQAEVAEEKSDASEGAFKISLLPTPAKFAESVNLEQEGIPSKVLTVYDNSQKKLTDLTHPVPILDSIGEHEKYGNNGDMFDGISRSIVNGYEAFSNLLNTFITKPKELARSISKGITAQLDILGGKIVGL